MSSGRIAWLRPDDPPDLFPPASDALEEPNGLLAAGADLGEARLLAAYRQGIFPWYEAGQPILWWSPDPRCVLRPVELKVSRRLRQYARGSSLNVSFNQDFATVIRACADRRGARQGTWITPEMISAYTDLHARGWAHSIEIRQADEQLVGGMYGLAIGPVFFGESMFSDADNASKFAMVALAAQMLATGMDLLDCQVASPHLLSMGAALMPRAEFRNALRARCESAGRQEHWPAAAVPVAEALHGWHAAALH